MLDHDRSASRGEMNARGLYVFKHSNALGNAAASDLLERLTVERNAGVEVARSFGDYMVTVNSDNLPNGVELLTKLG